MVFLFRNALMLGAAGLVLSGCASNAAEKIGLRQALALNQADAEGPATAGDPPRSDASPYGLFLAGNAALSDGQTGQASRYLTQLSQLEDEDGGFIKERAFTAAVLAGDIRQAARLAPAKTEGTTSSQRLGRLAQAVEAMATGDGVTAAKALADDMNGPPHGTAAALLLPWANAEAGDTSATLVPLAAPDTPAADLLARYGQAVLLERAKKYKEAEAGYKSLFEKSQGIGLFSLGYGEFLERRGRRPDAIALYDGLLKDNPDNLGAKNAKARVQARRPAPPVPTELQGAGQSMIGLAANLIGRQPQNAFIYLRLALRLDPTRNDAWIMLGEFLEQSGDRDGARTAYGRVAANAPEYLAARVRLAASYESDKDLDSALRIARETVQTAPNDADAQALLANLLSTARDYVGAVKVLDGLIGAEGTKANWRLYYTRAIALERAGRWNDSEADLQKALSLAPNQPEVLNYLGYSWADRGQRLPDALAMLQKAVQANPTSGAMIDSLGWVYYRMGDYRRAVDNLERAVMLDPSDPDVNNHLGDVYWRLDRKIEARYQWERVLTLDPDAKIKAEVEAKLKTGLPSLTITTAAAGG